MGYLDIHQPLHTNKRETELAEFNEALKASENAILRRRALEDIHNVLLEERLAWQNNLPTYELESLEHVIPERGGDPTED